MTYADLILRTGGLMSPHELGVLATCAARAPEGLAVEVGHYTGCTTSVLLDSLPADMPFVTIDSHQWRNSSDAFESQVASHVKGRDVFRPMFMDVEEALASLDSPISFVFYDADHTNEAIVRFWRIIAGRLRRRCIFIVDDIDWTPEIEPLLETAGFVRHGPGIYRHTLAYTTGDRQIDADLAKRHPDTFTLGIWER